MRRRMSDISELEKRLLMNIASIDWVEKCSAESRLYLDLEGFDILKCVLLQERGNIESGEFSWLLENIERRKSVYMTNVEV